MHFPNFSTFIAQGLALISGLQSDLKSQNTLLSCPDTARINNQLDINKSIHFPGFQYRDNSNRIVKNYVGNHVRKLNTVFIQTEKDRLNASANCDYEDTRGNHFTLAMKPELVERLDKTQLNKNHWSSFFGGGLMECGYGKMPEKQIIKECKFPLRNN